MFKRIISYLILEINYDFNIILIQEPSWTTIRSIPSSENCEGIPLVGIPNHPNWLTFARGSDLANDFPRVTIYVNIRLLSLCFSLCKDIINHRDILLVSFCNNNILFWIMNIYSNSSHSALKYLMLWQPLDQCPIAVLTINLKGEYLVGNMSCVIHKRT